MKELNHDYAHSEKSWKKGKKIKIKKGKRHEMEPEVETELSCSLISMGLL